MLSASSFTADNGAIAEEEGFAHMLVHLTFDEGSTYFFMKTNHSLLQF